MISCCVSIPLPPVTTSLPSPLRQMIVSSPSPPVIVSLPGSPAIVSLPPPPSIVSSPPPPFIVSLSGPGNEPAGSRVTVGDTVAGVMVSFAAVPVNVAIGYPPGLRQSRGFVDGDAAQRQPSRCCLADGGDVDPRTCARLVKNS